MTKTNWHYKVLNPQLQIIIVPNLKKYIAKYIEEIGLSDCLAAVVVQSGIFAWDPLGEVSRAEHSYSYILGAGLYSFHFLSETDL